MSNFNILSEIMCSACNLAVQSVNTGTGPFGCVITDSSYNIIAAEHNHVTEWNDPTAHAEIVCIRKACSNLNTFDLNRLLLFTSCEPCPMCLSAIYWAKITNIFYCNTREDAKNVGFDDEFIYDEIKRDINERKVKMTRIIPHGITNEGMEGFHIWQQLQNKNLY